MTVQELIDRLRTCDPAQQVKVRQDQAYLESSDIRVDYGWHDYTSGMTWEDDCEYKALDPVVVISPVGD